MSESLVSVIVPTYNRAALLGRALRSVLGQTHRALELIVVDDASDDGTAHLVQGLAAADSRVRYLRQAQRGGPAMARNAGLRAARGDYVAFQDSDDEWLVSKLQRQLAVLEAQPEVGIAFCGFILLQGAQPPRYCGAEPRMTQHPWPVAALYAAPFITPTWLLRRELLDRLGGFDESMPNLEDWELSFRLHAHTRFAVADEPLVVKYGGPDGHDAKPGLRLASFERLLARHGELLARDPDILARHWHEIGRLRFARGDRAASQAALWRAWRLAPRRLDPLWLALAAPTGVVPAYRRLRGRLQGKRS